MNLFDLIAPIYEKAHSGQEQTFKKLSGLADFKKTDRVLDLGGGAGRVAKFFVGRVQEITVLDASSGMMAQCRKKEGINCVLGKADKIPFADNYFDKVIIVDAFHHFQNHPKVVQEIRRILKENGKAMVEEVDFGKLGNWILEKLETISGAKSKIYSRQAVAELFSKNQFKVKLLKHNRSSYYLTAAK